MAVEEIPRSLVAGQFAIKLFDKDECSKSITNLRRPLTCRLKMKMCSFSSPIFFLSIPRLVHQANLSIAGNKYLLLFSHFAWMAPASLLLVLDSNFRHCRRCGLK